MGLPQLKTSTNGKTVVFSPSKVGADRERIEAYLRGEKIYPLTIELDLTQRCTRACPACPYGAARQPGLTLPFEFLDRLFAILGPHTPGIVLSGGEPTSVPHYPETLRAAREHGFKEIATITNGTLLDREEIQDALLEYGSSVRVSLYDWQEENSHALLQTLKRIENLRNRIEKTGSQLEIAASMLTKADWAHRIPEVGKLALKTGIHWLYFHPFCEQWETLRPQRADQTGVVEAVEGFQNSHPRGCDIQFPYERYDSRPLQFENLHGSFFLIQVGADGINYAGPECKYEEDYALLDLNEHMADDFLWHPQRVEKILSMNSENYRPIGTKHRPPIFSDYLQRRIDNEVSASDPVDRTAFHHPNII
jgi:organic radical activating enzyme